MRSDYGTRLRDLDRKARPLKEQARREYARLSELRQQCEQGLRAARLDTEELQFRHELGEFEEKEFQQQLESSRKQEEERGQELAAAERLTESFVEAFRSRDELEEPTTDAVVAPEPPAVQLEPQPQQAEPLAAEPAGATIVQQLPSPPPAEPPVPVSTETTVRSPEKGAPTPMSPPPSRSLRVP